MLISSFSHAWAGASAEEPDEDSASQKRVWEALKSSDDLQGTEAKINVRSILLPVNEQTPAPLRPHPLGPRARSEQDTRLLKRWHVFPADRPEPKAELVQKDKAIRSYFGNDKRKLFRSVFPAGTKLRLIGTAWYSEELMKNLCEPSRSFLICHWHKPRMCHSGAWNYIDVV